LEERLTFHEVSADRWADFERLFEARGGAQVLLVHGLASVAL
jgi:hypothetical protein